MRRSRDWKRGSERRDFRDVSLYLPLNLHSAKPYPVLIFSLPCLQEVPISPLDSSELYP